MASAEPPECDEASATTPIDSPTTTRISASRIRSKSPPYGNSPVRCEAPNARPAATVASPAVRRRRARGVGASRASSSATTGGRIAMTAAL
ncbi:hypothetical protein Aab01nite_07950 [Paractinoplanes abujensis]|uniref:Uncharacterized protein n=1 Tax=Paractinoplanes abujensis TaxID=882441 RepID=A0A7W7CMP7_9ACTN|nr:hypothetical protein [Actinoplanes abujensis]MBB4691381.1 hypothetical protein [Actinoplanes abujensis]GID17205.1 hypothetical protein Aab01nite_07950 [Actinoplanes abujensis]